MCTLIVISWVKSIPICWNISAFSQILPSWDELDQFSGRPEINHETMLTKVLQNNPSAKSTRSKHRLNPWLFSQSNFYSYQQQHHVQKKIILFLHPFSTQFFTIECMHSNFHWLDLCFTEGQLTKFYVWNDFAFALGICKHCFTLRIALSVCLHAMGGLLGLSICVYARLHTAAMVLGAW